MSNDMTGGGLYLVIPYAVAHDVQLSMRAKLLYGEIVRLATSKGYCYASNKALMDVLTYEDPATGAINGVTERTLQRLLAELRDRGHIYTDTGRVPCTNGSSAVLRRIFVGPRLAEPESDAGGDKIVTPPRQNCHPGGDKNVTPIKCKKNINRNNPLTPCEVTDVIDAYIGDDPEYREAMEALLKNRRAMGKPIRTRQAMSMIINKLRKVNQRETEIAMLNKAVELNWLTVYPLKPDELPTGTGNRVVEEEGVTYV